MELELGSRYPNEASGFVTKRFSAGNFEIPRICFAGAN